MRGLAIIIQAMVIAVEADNAGFHAFVHQRRDHLQTIGQMTAEIRQRLDEQRRRHSVAPVSYTHLDVYKRQLQAFGSQIRTAVPLPPGSA